MWETEEIHNHWKNSGCDIEECFCIFKKYVNNVMEFHEVYSTGQNCTIVFLGEPYRMKTYCGTHKRKEKRRDTINSNSVNVNLMPQSTISCS